MVFVETFPVKRDLIRCFHYFMYIFVLFLFDLYTVIRKFLIQYQQIIQGRNIRQLFL